MKLPFIKAFQGCDVEASFANTDGTGELKGNLSKFQNIVKFEGKFTGEVHQTCDICSEGYTESICEDVTLYISDGEYSSAHQENENLDVVEFYDGFINFDEIIDGEIAMKKLDYHRCENCENK